MELPLQITFRHMEPSEEIEAIIREKASKLDRFANHIISCRVVVEPAAKQHEHGNPYDVRIDITVPNDEIAVTRNPADRIEYKNIRTVIRDAFDAARRQLEDYMRRVRGDVKQLDAPPRAKVARIFPEENYGFLLTSDGREIYFHRNAVLHDGFDDLEVGTEVSFSEEPGEKGPQATTVKPVGTHGHKW